MGGRVTPIAAFAAGILAGFVVATVFWMVWAYRAMKS